MSVADFDFSALSAAERILLAESLWESVINAQPHAISVSDAQKQEIEKRQQALSAGEISAESWDKVKQRLQAEK